MKYLKILLTVITVVGIFGNAFANDNFDVDTGINVVGVNKTDRKLIMELFINHNIWDAVEVNANEPFHLSGNPFLGGVNHRLVVRERKGGLVCIKPLDLGMSNNVFQTLIKNQDGEISCEPYGKIKLPVTSYQQFSYIHSHGVAPLIEGYIYVNGIWGHQFYGNVITSREFRVDAYIGVPAVLVLKRTSRSKTDIQNVQEYEHKVPSECYRSQSIGKLSDRCRHIEAKYQQRSGKADFTYSPRVYWNGN